METRTEKKQQQTLGLAVLALERIAMAIGSVVASQLGDVDQSVKAARLSQIGYSNIEIAKMLGSTANSIAVALHRRRSVKRGRRSSKRKPR